MQIQKLYWSLVSLLFHLWVWLPVLRAGSEMVPLCNLGCGCCGKCCERAARSNTGATCCAWELQKRSGSWSLNYTAVVPLLGHVLWQFRLTKLDFIVSLRTCLHHGELASGIVVLTAERVTSTGLALLFLVWALAFTAITLPALLLRSALGLPSHMGQPHLLFDKLFALVRHGGGAGVGGWVCFTWVCFVKNNEGKEITQIEI